MKKILKERNARKLLKKLETLEKVSENGKIFSVDFIKKDGSLRSLTCRKGVTKYLKGGENTTRHIKCLKNIPVYQTVYSLEDEGYRNINLKTIKKIAGQGKTYQY